MYNITKLSHKQMFLLFRVRVTVSQYSLAVNQYIIVPRHAKTVQNRAYDY
jgi:hypothetical protein